MSQNQKGEIKKSVSVFLVLIMVFGSYLLPIGSVWAEDIEYDAFYESIDVNIDADGGYEGAITLNNPSPDAALTLEEVGVFSEEDSDTADSAEGDEGTQTYFNLIPDAALTFVSAFYESIVGVAGVEDETITFCAGASDDGTLTQSEVIRQLSEGGLSIRDTFYAMFNDTVESIGNRAFANCTGLISVIISDNVTSIDVSAFSGCVNLTEVTISDSVESIGASAFIGCRSLTNITIPSRVESIGASAFSGCSKLTEVEIPDSVESIGSSAFSSCSGLISVTISNSVTSIGASTFSNCINLADVKIPDKVVSIGASAFNSCTSLTRVTIPASVESIGNGAFSSCTSLTRIDVSEGNKNYSSDESGVLYDGDKTTLVICPAGRDNCTIPDGVLSIGNYAFFGCKYIAEIEIPDSLLDIGLYAFANCSGLTDVTFGNSLERIRDSAFGVCTSLTSIVIPDSVTNIGYGAFHSCRNLINVIIGNSLKEIGNSAFFDTQIETVTLPLTVEAYGAFGNQGVFFGMDALKSIVFEPGTTEAAIPANTFLGISIPIDVFIPKNVKNISDDCGLNQNTTVSAFVGSYAEEYAIAKEIPFEPLPTILVDTPDVPVGYQNIPYSFKFKSSNNAKLNVTFDANWPGSLTISAIKDDVKIRDQDEIYGTPTEAGAFKLNVEAVATDGKVYPLKDEGRYEIEILKVLLTQEEITREINRGKRFTPMGIYVEEDDIYVIEVPYKSERFDIIPKDQVMIIDCDFDDFIDLWIDGQKLERDPYDPPNPSKREKDYYAEPGSTRITVYGQTFTKLDPDIERHVIVAEFREGGRPEGEQYTVAQNFEFRFIKEDEPSPSEERITQSSGGSGSMPEVIKPDPLPKGEPPVVWPFLDVKDTDWFAEDVKWVYENGIMLGVSDTAFAPYSPINPAMIVTALSRMLKVNMGAYSMAADGKWYSEALAWGIDIGLFDGIDELSYDMILERGQISIILAGLLLGAEVDATINEDSFIFYDVDLMSPEALGAFKLLNTLGIMNGKGNGMMDPLGVTTRAELAAILHRTNVYINALLTKYGAHE